MDKTILQRCRLKFEETDKKKKKERRNRRLQLRVDACHFVALTESRQPLRSETDDGDIQNSPRQIFLHNLDSQSVVSANWLGRMEVNWEGEERRRKKDVVA